MLVICGLFYYEFNDDWNLLVVIDYINDKLDLILDFVVFGNDVDNDIFIIELLLGIMCFVGGLLLFGCFFDYDQELISIGIMGWVEGMFGNLDFIFIIVYRELEDEFFMCIGFFYLQMIDQDQFSQEFIIG